MAFQIIPGTATTPDQYIGTNEADAANIQSITSGLGQIELTGLGGNDSVVLAVDPTDSSFSLGEGDDIFTGNVLGGTTLVGGFVNGNRGRDQIGNPQFGFNATLARLQGGQDGDTIHSANLQGSIVNGNNGDDAVFSGPGTAAGVVNVANSSIFGGQGNDTVTATAGAGSGYVNSVIGGNLGNDELFITLTGGAIFQGSRVEGNEGDDLLDGSASTTALDLDGGEGDDDVLGGTGNDDIVGGAGADSLVGGAGSDAIDGGTDGDFINGGAGADELTGGRGSNQFQQFAGSTESLGLFDATINRGTTSAAPNPSQPSVNPITGNLTYFGSNGSVVDVLQGGVAGTISAGDTVTLNSGFDVITDWAAGAGANKIATGAAGLVLANFGLQGDMSFGYNLVGFNPASVPNFLTAGNTFNFAVRGTWTINANGTESFEVAATPTGGSDILVATATISGPLATDANGIQDQIVRSFNSVTNWTVLDNVGTEFVNSGTFV